MVDMVEEDVLTEDVVGRIVDVVDVEGVVVSPSYSAVSYMFPSITICAVRLVPV